jgi:hypothetical protein
MSAFFAFNGRLLTHLFQGTDEFMSDGLLEAARLDKRYLQSPLDDLWSFYYVAQWAAVFNSTKFPDSIHVPAELAELRRLMAGSQYKRALGTRTVTDPGLDGTEYGPFLADSCSFLREWESKLRQLAAEWKAAKVGSLSDGNLYDACYSYFREYTNRGLLELVQLVQRHFPGSLSGLS